ncbi:EXD3 [Symbiodinium sp. KB8]|nr:EXD3 [Symbiodinium sp. KB8]
MCSIATKWDAPSRFQVIACAIMVVDSPGALIHGFRLGSVVEVDGASFNDRLGQVVAFSEKDGVFNVALLNGSTRQARPDQMRQSEGRRPGHGSAGFDVLLGPRHRQDFLAEEVATCLVEKGFCVLKMCQPQQEVEQAFEYVKSLAQSGKLDRLPEEVEEGYLGEGARARVAWMDPSDRNSLQLLAVLAVERLRILEHRASKLMLGRLPHAEHFSETMAMELASVQTLVQACDGDDEDGFIEEIRTALSGGFQSARVVLESAKAKSAGAFGEFALRCLVKLVSAPVAEPWRPQAAALFADLGRGTVDVPSAGVQALLVKLATAPSGGELSSSMGGLKLLTRVMNAWAIRAEQLSEEAHAAIAQAVVRDSVLPGAWALAAVTLGSFPDLLTSEMSNAVIKEADDGSRDDAVLQMAKSLGVECQRFLVQLRQERGRLKAAAKVLQLQDLFPDAGYLWRQEALEAAIEKGRREAVVGLGCEEVRLRGRCVDGLLQCGEVELAVDLADAWAVGIPEDVRKANAERAKAEVPYLRLPPDVDVQLVATEASIEGMRGILLDASVIGVDLECNMGTGAPTLLQLATLCQAFLVDLQVVGSWPSFATAMQDVCSGPARKVGFGIAEDLGQKESPGAFGRHVETCGNVSLVGKLSKSFPCLTAAACAAPLSDLRDVEAQLRSLESGIGKKRAREGISLSALAEKYLGKPLDKAFQVGDWSHRPLSQARMHYAALDAWVPVKVYEAVQTSPPQPQPASAKKMHPQTGLEDKILKESDEFVSTMAALLQPYCEDALGKVVDARTPGLVSLSFPPSEDVEPQPTEDYILASFYSTWRRSQLKMMHFLGPGAAQVRLKPKEDDTAGEEAGHQGMDDFTHNLHVTEQRIMDRRA